MAFLFGGTAVLFLRANDLFVFINSDQTKQVVFPTTVIRNQEVVDKKLFEKLLKEFFSRLPKEKGVLFLSHAIVFDKSVKVEPQIVVEEELKKFLEAIPLPATHVAMKAIQTSQRNFFYATNGDIYETILAIARQYGWQIGQVVPLSLFDELLKGQQVSYAFFLRAFANKKLLEKGNFLEREAEEEKEVPFKQYFMLGVSLVFLSGAFIFMAYTFNFFPFSVKTQPKKAAVISPAKQVVVSNTPTPTSVEKAKFKKEDIKIQVLNGSGIAGQAGKLKDQLETLAYDNIEIGNAEGPISNATIVIFSENVAQNLQDEILIELKKTFTSVDSQQLPVTEGFDVAITTGDVK